LCKVDETNPDKIVMKGNYLNTGAFKTFVVKQFPTL
jgi:hypothetical protein